MYILYVLRIAVLQTILQTSAKTKRIAGLTATKHIGARTFSDTKHDTLRWVLGANIFETLSVCLEAVQQLTQLLSTKGLGGYN